MTRQDALQCRAAPDKSINPVQYRTIEHLIQGTERDGIYVTHLGACCEEHDDFALQVGLQEAEQDVKFLRQSHLRGKELSRSDGQVLWSKDVERR